MSLIIVLMIILVMVYLIKTVIKPRNYPPGPRWYPFFGCHNKIQVKSIKLGSQWKALQEMAREYRTKVLGLKMGSEMVVVVFGEKNIRFVCNEMNFNARPDSFFNKLRTFGKRCGVTFVDGPLWREHRQFLVKSLRNEGFAKEVMQCDIQTETDKMLKILKSSNGKPVNIRFHFSMAVTNIIWKYVAGEHLREVQIHQFISLMTRRTKLFTMAGGWLNQWPWLRFIIPNMSGFSIIQEINSQMIEIIQESIKKHKDGIVNGSDYINRFIDEMHRESFTVMKYGSNSWGFTEGITNRLGVAPRAMERDMLGYSLRDRIRNEEIDRRMRITSIAKRRKHVEEYASVLPAQINSIIEDQLRGVLADILIASIQTTSSVLGFAIIALIRNKDIYDKIYNEINTILGNNTPKGEDCTRLVYTSAFLCEILRKFTIAPFSGPRKALKDTILDGYTIPKGTTILLSLGDLHSDPEMWDEPEKFEPERFIGENGDLENTRKIYPFGIGRRACPGEPLSKSFIFIVIVSIVQKFKIQCSNGVMPSDEPIIGLLSEPRPFTARFIERLQDS